MDKKISGMIIACQKAEIDEKSGFISIHKIIPALQVVVTPQERLSIGKEPRGIKAPMDILAILDKQANAIDAELTFDCVLEFIDPRGVATMERMQSHAVVPADSDRYYVFFRIEQGIMTSVPGRHFFRMLSLQPEVTGTEMLGEMSLMVNMLDAEGRRITI